jgi:hypothetical protein
MYSFATPSAESSGEDVVFGDMMIAEGCSLAHEPNSTGIHPIRRWIRGAVAPAFVCIACVRQQRLKFHDPTRRRHDERQVATRIRYFPRPLTYCGPSSRSAGGGKSPRITD